MKNQKQDGGLPSGRIADARFASFETDPRFRLPSKKHSKTTIDERFAGMLKDDDFTATARVDRYGRKIKSDAKKKALERLYRAEDQGDDAHGDEPEDEDVDDEELVQRELRAAHDKATQKKYDPARGGGFSSSESDSDSDDDSQEDDDDDAQDGGASVAEGDMQRLQDEQAEVESGQVTNRIAVVNLDWDHVKSTDLMALFSSFLAPNSGRILKISIYPSEFGKERMQQEELEGPPKALFKSQPKERQVSEDSGDSDTDSDSGDEKVKKQLIQEGDDQDFDGEALRTYQLHRLRYYYAVMVCTNPETAQQIYEATDGTEFQSSSNVIDLRFVPDDVTFDDDPRDECEKVPDSYKPVDFVTNALQSSKVKLTWDMHPEEASRKESIKRAFGGSRAEVEENDLRAYLASDSEESDHDLGQHGGDQAEAGEAKLSKKELARKTMREALGLADHAAPKAPSHGGPVGEMQITFAPALTDSKSKKEAGTEETTVDKYKRKEKERKERKRLAAKARREPGYGDGDETQAAEEQRSPDDAGHDLGFDDPFFTTEDAMAAAPKASSRKEERRKKREARQTAEAESAKQKASLAKVMAEGNDEAEAADHLDHFDMKEIVRAEKKKGKKEKAKQKQSRMDKGRGGLQEDFDMDVGDDRFRAVFDSHEYAIDPSNPKFKGTGGMRKLLEEGRKKRKAGGEEVEEGGRTASKKAKKGKR